VAGGVLVGRGYVSIRPEFEGDWSRSVSSRASSAGRSGAGAFSKAFGAGLKGIGALAGVAIGANLSSAAAGAAVLAPALATAGAAAGALKLGLSGVGDAFKAAFADSSSQASSAASATKAVESAQRGLAKAQQGLADARVQAAERIKDAQKAVGEAEQNLARVVEESAQRQKDAQLSVMDAERDLKDAQADARQAQLSLNDARNEAVRSLQDMNDQLAGARLDEREAVMRQAEAEKALRAAQQNPGVTPEQLAKLQLAYDRAALNLSEQRRETKELATDTAKANKAGVEGSTQVTQAKQRIAQANQTVVDRERDLTKARETQRRTAVDSARDIADAQQGVADAQADVAKARQEGSRQIRDAEQAVADAASAVADAQAAAAAQTSAYAQAMAKLAPNAQSFVRAVQGLAPAWDAMKMSVQNRLFEGLDSTVTSLGRTTIPILQRQLTATAGVWNSIAKNAAGAVMEMAKSGQLDQILAGATKNLAVFQKTPGQIVTAFGQLAVAAQPAFNQLLTQFAGAITSFTDGIAASFTSGGLQDAITTAFGILSSFGTLLGNALGVVTEIFKAASDAGGQIVGVLGTVLGTIRDVLAGPEIQAALRQLFGSIGQIVAAIAPVFGSIVQAVVPLLATIAPFVAQLAEVLGPVLQQLVTSLGAALMPVIQALMPVLLQVGTAIVQIVQAVMPLLQPIGELIAGVISALAPALTPIINIITLLVRQLVGPLSTVVRALTPVFVTLGKIIGQVFTALGPLLTPLIKLVGQVAQMLAGVLSKALMTVMGALRPLIPVGIQLIQSVIGALTPVLPVLGKAFGMVAQALVQIVAAIVPVVAQFASSLGPVIKALVPVISQIATTIGSTLMAVLPPLLQALVTLAPAFGQIVGLVVKLGADVITALLPSLGKLIPAAVQLVLALVPILPPLAKIISLVVQLAVRVLSWLLPPLIKLAGFLIGKLAGALATAIRWISNIIGWIVKLVGWVRDKLGPIMNWLNGKVIQPVWRRIREAVSAAWGKIRPVFDTLKTAVGRVGDAFKSARDAIKKAWGQLQDITKKPVNFVIKWVYTNGIKAVWDKVASFVGLSKLPKAPKLLAKGGTVGDGFGPARPMVTNRPTAIVGEGNPRFPEFVIPTDPKYRTRALALHQAAGTKLMADGGILGSIGSAWDWTKDKVSDVVGKGIDWAKKGADLLANPSKIWDSLMKPVIGKIAKGVGDSQMGKAIGKIPRKMISGLKDKIVSAAKSLFADGGQWVKPVDVPYGTPFGKRGPMWSSGYHTGLDFPAAVGKAVKAVADGSITSASSGGPYGKHISISHGGGLSSLYAHLSNIIKSSGVVKAGQRIGSVGATGNVTGPHLHLEARRNGRAVDPMPFLTSGGGFNAQAVGAAQQYAKSILSRYGWGPSQFGPLKKLWQGESGWRWNAKNASSGAYGIPQALPANKMASAGPDWRTNAKTQIRWGLSYIKGRPDYGSPSRAWSKWQSRSPHWYDSGGFLQPGLNLAYNGTGSPEPVLTGQQWNLLANQSGTSSEPVVIEIHTRDQALAEFIDVRVIGHQDALVRTVHAM
jgi:phage-related protein